MGAEYAFLEDNVDKKETETVEKKENYSSLDEAMKSITEWSGLNARKLKRVVSPPLFAFLGMPFSCLNASYSFVSIRDWEMA
jgi:hypothetical protein